jgi:hypothetical protein
MLLLPSISDNLIADIQNDIPAILVASADTPSHMILLAHLLRLENSDENFCQVRPKRQNLGSYLQGIGIIRISDISMLRQSYLVGSCSGG